MELKIFGIGKSNIFDVIAGIILFFVGNKVKNISLTEKDILKFYYEVNLFLEKHNVFSIVDKESFLKFIKTVLDQTEGIFEEQKKSDPEFVDKLLKKHAWLWNIYVSINDFFDVNDIAALMNSDFTKGIKDSLNKKIIEDEELLNYKIKRDVDVAIQEYEKVEMFEPSDFQKEAIITEKKNENNPFGFDEIRIRGSWVKDKE